MVVAMGAKPLSEPEAFVRLPFKAWFPIITDFSMVIYRV